MTKDLQDKYGSVSEPYWGEVWITGGGSSFYDFDFKHFAGNRVLAVNDTIHQLVLASVPVGRSLVPYELSSFSLDNRWVRRNKHLLGHSEGLIKEKFVALPLETWPECADIPGVTYLQWSNADGLSDDPGVICTGGNSGYGAINVAYLKRSKMIHLVGFDMNPIDNTEYLYWARAFRTMLPQLRKQGVTVLNHNKQSYIDAFLKIG